MNQRVHICVLLSPSVRPCFSLLICLDFVFQLTASLSAKTEECASGLSSVSASLAQAARHVSRRLCPHTPFQRSLGKGRPTITAPVTWMDTTQEHSGPYLRKCLLMFMISPHLKQTTLPRWNWLSNLPHSLWGRIISNSTSSNSKNSFMYLFCDLLIY